MQLEPFRLDIPSDITLNPNLDSLINGIDQQQTYLSRAWFKGMALNDSFRITKQTLQQTAQLLKGHLSANNSFSNFPWHEDYDFHRLSGNDSLGNVLFTGYFTPILHVKSEKDSVFQYPFYKYPGQRRGSSLPDRKAIDFEKVLAGKNLEIAWSDNLFDNFVLQVQGSGIVEFEDGKKQLLAYGGKNGYSYTSIGKHLITLGEIEKEKMSLSAIRDWLTANPNRMPEILSVNESYVFFRLVSPVVKGSANVPLTPHHSAAVDSDIIPLGSTLLAEVPMLDKQGQLIGHEYRILLAQDRGGAIKGTGRIDLYCGIGEQGMQIANSLNHYGRVWLMTPKGQ